MKFYSETLKKLFNTEAELIEAEAAELKRIEEKEKGKQEILAHAENICTELELAMDKLEKCAEFFTVEDLEEIYKVLIGQFTRASHFRFYPVF